MFIVFLDFDGVLVTEQGHFYYNQRGEEKRKEFERSDRFCPIAVSNINYLCANVPELKVVISSSWRNRFSLEQIEMILKEDGFLHSDRLIGTTPVRSLSGDRRYNEIMGFLERNPDLQVDDWIAIDDHEYNIPPERLCKTKQEVGFTIFQAYELIEKFKPGWPRPIFLM